MESTFRAAERKFGADVVSESPTAMGNGVPRKFICHDLTCLIRGQGARGIVPVFWEEEGGTEQAARPLVQGATPGIGPQRSVVKTRPAVATPRDG